MMTLSIRNFDEPGRTRPEARLMTIRTKPTARSPRRGRINSKISGSSSHTRLDFSGLATASSLEVGVMRTSAAARQQLKARLSRYLDESGADGGAVRAC